MLTQKLMLLLDKIQTELGICNRPLSLAYATGVNEIAYGCRSSCSGDCEDSCAGGCEGSCSGSCDDSCDGSCTYSASFEPE